MMKNTCRPEKRRWGAQVPRPAPPPERPGPWFYETMLACAQALGSVLGARLAEKINPFSKSKQAPATYGAQQKQK